MSKENSNSNNGYYNGHSGEMFRGLTPSIGLRELTNKAFGLGLDPTLIINRAVQAAREEKRNKVGAFGGAEKHVRGLEEVVDYTIWERQREKRLGKPRSR